MYRDLRTPWGETFEFGSGSRALIAPEIRSRIHQLNSLDEELWKAGNELLEVSVCLWVSKWVWCVWCGLVPSKAGFYLLGASLQLPGNFILQRVPGVQACFLCSLPSCMTLSTCLCRTLQGKLAEQREAGLLQTFPPWTAAGRQRRHQGRNETSTRRRALQSDEEAKTGEGQKGKPAVHDSGESLYASEPAASAEDDATRQQGTAAADAAALGADVSATAAAGAEATTTEAHTRLTAAEARGVGDAANNVGGNTNALSRDDGFLEAASSEAPAQLLQEHDEL